ncbi:DUF2971 domain-containing protein [Hydrogenovibrio sp. JE_KL2]|uniref:DUF2971 domain-containing protein n=1 Tax=Hydrogenovibrio sp. JE_KL2 TaxID=2651188 RepID=UPI00128C58EE|nr:DUF2971 domain-containing protein [Hydrogenovibrio sp. JE_KL2]MPQ77306.1 DUF2971 domain-containing protein [Hydrogenovibrio sp. JE_KL2]
MNKIPEMFYKYRAFNTFTLESLYNDEIYYSNPRDFNDPFDCNPIIERDSSKEELKNLLALLIKSRVANESKALLRKLRLNDESAERHANKVADLESRDALDDIKYNATNPDYKISKEQAELALLTESISREIKKHYSKGIFSLASDCEDPLMWSHYADKHKGICVGYSLERASPPKPQKAVYEGSRVIKTSTIHNALLNGSKKALNELEKAILLRKGMEI